MTKTKSQRLRLKMLKTKQKTNNAQTKQKTKNRKQNKNRQLNNVMVNLTSTKSHLSNIKGSRSSARHFVTHIEERLERVGVVNSTTDFANDYYLALNPGLTGTFPWLSTIAQNYELYQFRKLWFEYRTISGEVVSGTNPALGKVLMATNYDVTDPLLGSIDEFENYEGCTNFPPFQTVARHYVDVGGRGLNEVLPYKKRYIRTGTLPATTLQGGSNDPHAYDIGLFQVGTYGMPADGNTVGELWVGYSIDLIKPKMTTKAPGYSAKFDIVKDNADIAAHLADAEVNPKSTLNVTYSNPAHDNTKITVSNAPLGIYSVTALAHTNGVDAAISLCAITGSSGCSVKANEQGFYGSQGSCQNFGSSPVTATKGSSWAYLYVYENPFSFYYSLSYATGASIGPNPIDNFACITIQQVLFPPDDPFAISVFAPSNLVRQFELERLKEMVEQLSLRVDDEEKYSIISDLSKRRQTTPSVSRAVSPVKRL